MKPKVIVITGYGINCDEETAFAFNKVGADVEIVHINDLTEDKSKLKSAQILVFPGGFSYGDDTGSGKAFANKIKNNLFTEIKDFIKRGNLIIGICNGFQILVNLGLLPAANGGYGEKQVALLHNQKARFECRWVKIRVESNICVFTKGIKEMNIPIAHGEGNFYADEKMMSKMNDSDQVVFRYVKEDSTLAEGEFPFNPNGALEDVAGICDETGHILGMMPHPERSISFLSHPDYYEKREQARRRKIAISEIYEPALMIFENAVNYFKQKD